jgi:glycosyltransferase involved in cell wall biosynthesis
MPGIKVVYDISQLGEGYRHAYARTGLFRAVENVAVGLVNSPECEVSFCALASPHDLYGALDYLQRESKLNGSRFLSPPFAEIGRLFERRLSKANVEVAGGRPSDRKDFNASGSLEELKLFARVERRLLALAGPLLERNQQQIPTSWLTGVDIFHSPVHPIPEQVRNVQRFLTIYDLIPLVRPEFCTPHQIQFSKRLLESIRPDDWLLSISQATKNDLCSLSSIAPARVFVTPLACDHELFYRCTDEEQIALARKKHGIPEGPYILSVNTLDPRKNVALVIRSFAKLVQEQHLPDLSLVLVGTRGWQYEEILATVAGYDQLADRIILTGYVADEDLAALYSAAMVFVFLSFYEGFGLPALEAMQCGVPVITSNTSSLPEVVGNAGVMLDPEDADSLCHNILQVYRDSSLRAEMSKRSLARAREFSWGKCTEETIGAYKASLSA